MLTRVISFGHFLHSQCLQDDDDKLQAIKAILLVKRVRNF